MLKKLLQTLAVTLPFLWLGSRLIYAQDVQRPEIFEAQHRAAILLFEARDDRAVQQMRQRLQARDELLARADLLAAQGRLAAQRWLVITVREVNRKLTLALSVNNAIINEDDPAQRLAKERHLQEQRSNIEHHFLQRIHDIEKGIELLASQRSKLQLAAHSDANRVMREVEKLQGAIDSLMVENQGNLNQAAQIAQPLKMRWATDEMFQNSLFDKILVSNLSDEQRLKCERIHLESAIDVVNVSLLLTHEQREQLIQRLLEDESILPFWNEKVGMSKLAKIDKTKLADVLTGDQLNQFETLRPKPLMISNMMPAVTQGW